MIFNTYSSLAEKITVCTSEKFKSIVYSYYPLVRMKKDRIKKDPTIFLFFKNNVLFKEKFFELFLTIRPHFLLYVWKKWKKKKERKDVRVRKLKKIIFLSNFMLENIPQNKTINDVPMRRGNVG